MTEPQACGGCLHWRKHPHKSANWGSCDQAQFGELMHSTAELMTRDVFYCAQFQQKPQPSKPSLVDTVREAAKSYHKTLKEQ